MAHSLIISSSYTDVAIAHAQNGTITQTAYIDKKDANRLLLVTINALLDQAQINLAALDYITVNRGPSPFTTLRVTLTTANGIAYATGIPLVGVDALQALLHVYGQEKQPVLVLLNAFGGDAYFGLKDTNGTVQTGCAPIEQALKTVTLSHAAVTVIGNGCTIFKDTLFSLPWSKQFSCDMTAPAYAPIETIAQLGHQQFMHGNTNAMLLPLYLKQPRAATSR